ncbi:hypothetical protein ACLOJK_013573, partial [Asimina triloba]
RRPLFLLPSLSVRPSFSVPSSLPPSKPHSPSSPPVDLLNAFALSSPSPFLNHLPSSLSLLSARHPPQPLL